MRLRIGLIALAAACAIADTASAFSSRNQMWVEGTPAEIEVFARAGRQTGPEMFCAAADFADRQLGARATDRLVVTRILSPSPTDPARKSMSFRLAPNSDRSGEGVLVTARRSLGQTRAVGHAVMFCW